jgi:hypothetical protein
MYVAQCTAYINVTRAYMGYVHCTRQFQPAPFAWMPRKDTRQLGSTILKHDTYFCQPLLAEDVSIIDARRSCCVLEFALIQRTYDMKYQYITNCMYATGSLSVAIYKHNACGGLAFVAHNRCWHVVVTACHCIHMYVYHGRMSLSVYTSCFAVAQPIGSLIYATFLQTLNF